MKIFRISDLSQIISDSNFRVVALGFFDGIHIAHQEIIKNTVDLAKEENKISSLITFTNSPKNFFTKEETKLLIPNNLKISILENLGIEELYFLDFNESLRLISKEKFIDSVLKKINVTNVFCGEDYRFGYKGEGRPNFISEYTDNKIKVVATKTLKSFDKKISSTLLRNYILNGKVELYKKLTNRFYQISGIIVKGRQLGRTINFPTANLSTNDDFLIPQKYGVYITIVEVRGEFYKGITNIGNNPTVSDNGKVFVETHILYFDKEIYGENFTIYFYKYIRPEQKFNSINELKEQLQLDKSKAEKIFIDFKNLII
ncbi:bifunctional riboflavin kinase/FAD synthetase [Gemella sp. zg-1178]|uniref:bifunctional riboflavin kinase/FAD synthetase n=1 Tax=Gemella sp. zg-1178 TaxID=2840372 RepID=UPI001C052198|nr:bifunctional riboflavin kinase/FAD synthetase [Gemella sp. zg-1178]MBU0278117.1 bifunctional riboflavin kinase/FAD synthetase [Gemella sp. zg-1178]